MGEGTHTGATMVKVRSHFVGPSTSIGTTRRFLRGRSTASSTSTTDGDEFSGLIIYIIF